MIDNALFNKARSLLLDSIDTLQSSTGYNPDMDSGIVVTVDKMIDAARMMRKVAERLNIKEL